MEANQPNGQEQDQNANQGSQKQYQVLFPYSYKGNIKDKYHFLNKLASGGFGLVYLAEDRNTKVKYAIKAIQKKKVEDFKTFVNEINILRVLDHPNIIKLYEIWEWDNVCFLVLEYCDGGELFNYIIEKKHLSEDIAAQIMHQLFAALEYLHSKQISHRDIKPQNFMLFKANDLSCIKMIDFGLSKDYSQRNTMHTLSGSPYYMAPEVFLQQYNSKIDIWSMGVVLYIMLSGKVPFPGRTEPEIIYNVVKGDFHFDYTAFNNVSEECKHLIKCCLVRDFMNRYNATEALAHPWITSRINQDVKTQGTIGDNGVSQQVIQDINTIMKQAQIKNAALQYLSKKITPNNFGELTSAFNEKDTSGSGFVGHDDFIRCLSKSNMKCSVREVQELVKELDSTNSGQVNYEEFLKYSYLCQMYIYHYQLEMMLFEIDQQDQKKGIVSVKQLEQILQNEGFNFPEQAVDKVLIEMLGKQGMEPGQQLQSIDRNCYIKIDTFMESLRLQFSDNFNTF